MDGGNQAKLSAACKSAKTCIILASSAALLSVSLLPVYWYTARKIMDTAARYYSSVQSDDPPQDNCCLVKSYEIIWQAMLHTMSWQMALAVYGYKASRFQFSFTCTSQILVAGSDSLVG
jgi:hypothetical protein